MIRLLLGVVVGAALGLGGGYLYIDKAKDCVRRCGDGTRCFSGRCIASAAPTTVAPSGKVSDKNGKRRRSGTVAGAAEARSELKLSPGDDHMSSAGDALGRPEHIDFAKSGDDGKELTQDALDDVFRGAQSGVTRCITEAVGDYPLDYGKILVRFRVERRGEVKRVRVDAPQLLLRRGLYSCVRPLVMALKFPASGGANVVEYPFALQ